VTSRRTRRAVLRGGAGLLGASAAGCAGLLDSGGVSLGGIEVRSDLSAPHEVRVELARGGDPVFAATVRVTPGEPVVRAASWDPAPARYTLRFAAFGPSLDGDIRARAFDGGDASDDADCHVATVSLAAFAGDPEAYAELLPAAPFPAVDCE
jgi:hypothetical protein